MLPTTLPDETKESISGAKRPLHLRRRISPDEIEAVCRLIAEKRFTDQEACQLIGINPMTFNRWRQKSKNDVRFSALIARLRAVRLENIINRIDDASLGKSMKQPDWRAAAWLAGVIDRERYGDQKVIASKTVVNNTHNNFLFLEAARKIYGGNSLKLEEKPTKQIQTNSLSLQTIEVKQVK